MPLRISCLRSIFPGLAALLSGLSLAATHGFAQSGPQLGYELAGSAPSEAFGAAIACVRHFSSLNGADSLAASAPFFGVGGRTQVFDGPTGQSVLASFSSPNHFVS